MPLAETSCVALHETFSVVTAVSTCSVFVPVHFIICVVVVIIVIVVLPTPYQKPTRQATPTRSLLLLLLLLFFRRWYFCCCFPITIAILGIKNDDDLPLPEIRQHGDPALPCDAEPGPVYVALKVSAAQDVAVRRVPPCCGEGRAVEELLASLF